MRKDILAVCVVILVIVMLSFSISAGAKNEDHWWGKPFQALWEAIFGLQSQIDDLEARVSALEGQEPPTECTSGDTRSCYTGPPETEGVGECQAGTESCVNDEWSGVCEGDVTPTPEVCDGLDNDCDNGTPDGSDESWYENPCDGADLDLCQEGTYSCTAGSQTCTDNDAEHDLDLCNGDTNDDCNPATADGTDEAWISNPCDGPDADECMDDIYECVGGSQVCSDTGGDIVEVCDGFDNDCDGDVDEGDPGGGGSCDTGQYGICAAGTEHCVSGSIQCVPNNAPGTEVCDGLDNDCDGGVDEGPLCIASDPHAIGACISGSCVYSCESGYHSCGTSGSEITCYSNDDIMHCGDDFSCTVCNIPNANAACVNGACVMTSCHSGYANCDANPGNGCEINLNSYSNTCSGAEYVGNKCGDERCGLVCSSTSWSMHSTITGRGSKWFSFRLDECSNCPADIYGRFTLTVPSGIDYNLYVYSACGNLWSSSTNSGSTTEQVTVSKTDNIGQDDDYYVWVEVRYYSGASCNNWALTFEGRSAC